MIRPVPPRARASWYATKSSVGRFSRGRVVWCAVETIRFGISIGPTASGENRWPSSGKRRLVFERRALLPGEGPRRARLAVARDEHGLGLCREVATRRDERLARRHARPAHPHQPAPGDDDVVVLRELTAKVDRNPCDDVVPEALAASERQLEPFV